MATLSVKKVLEFSSETLRSGVVVLSTDAPPGSALLFLRGAPAVIRSLVNPSTVPPDFDQVLTQARQWQILPVLSSQSSTLCWPLAVLLFRSIADSVCCCHQKASCQLHRVWPSRLTCKTCTCGA